MKSRIEVTNCKEAKQIRAGLTDPAARAFVKVVGILRALPTDRARRRVLGFVMDQEQESRVAAQAQGDE